MTDMEKAKYGWLAVAVMFILLSVFLIYKLEQTRNELAECEKSRMVLVTQSKYAINQREKIKEYLQAKHRLHSDEARHYADYIMEATEKYTNVSPELAASVFRIESNFNRYAVSNVGARGLGQVMPFWTRVKHFRQATGIKHVDELFNPRLNVRATVYVLSHYITTGGSEIRGVTQYHGGPKALTRPRASTIHYVSKVFRAYESI